MNYDETLKTLESLHSLIAGGGDDSIYDATQKRWISTLYKKEMGETIKECGCKNKYTDAVTLLYLRLRRKGELAENETYTMRAGEIIWLDGNCYSRHNLTDDIAKKYLALHPDAKSKFEKRAE